MALGADRARVVRLLVARGLRLVVVGGALGLALALAAARLLGGLLFEVDALDPLTCVGVRQHGNARLDAASARAMALGSYHYRTVRNILAAGQDRLPLEPPAEPTPTPAHDNIRGADYYAATTREDPC